MTARLALRFLAVFALVLAALSVGAYMFVGREYTSLMLPLLGTPEGAAAYGNAMRRVAWTIAAFDLPLLAIVGAASWLFARAAIEPLIVAQQRERAFAADAAHALRSPLATIASVSQAARAVDDAHAQTYDTIAAAALDASRTVGELLTLARSADERALVKEPIDVAAVARDTAREFTEIAAERGVTLDVRAQSAIVQADERRVRELTRNLLSNAVRHARARVVVDARRVDGGTELSVANDGDAVAPHDRERIFERFYRGPGRAEGSGLGLAIVRWIAHAHGGTAALRDGEGMTAFVVTFP